MINALLWPPYIQRATWNMYTQKCLELDQNPWLMSCLEVPDHMCLYERMANVIVRYDNLLCNNQSQPYLTSSYWWTDHHHELFPQFLVITACKFGNNSATKFGVSSCVWIGHQSRWPFERCSLIHDSSKKLFSLAPANLFPCIIKHRACTMRNLVTSHVTAWTGEQKLPWPQSLQWRSN